MQRKVRNSMPLKETVFVPLASSQMPGATPPSSKYDFSRTRVKKKVIRQQDGETTSTKKTI